VLGDYKNDIFFMLLPCPFSGGRAFFVKELQPVILRVKTTLG
jgi:hypothetical protein